MHNLEALQLAAFSLLWGPLAFIIFKHCVIKTGPVDINSESLCLSSLYFGVCAFQACILKPVY